MSSNEPANNSSSDPSESESTSLPLSDYVPPWRDELKQMLALAVPVSLTLLARIGMNLCDLAVLGHLSTDSLSSASVSFVWQNMTSSFLARGFGASVNTLCSQAMGAGNKSLVGIWFQLGLVLTLLFSIPIAILWFITEPVLILFGIDPQIAKDAGTFSKISIGWLFPFVSYIIVQRYLQSQHKVWAAVFVNLFFFFINLLLNIIMVFGINLGSLQINGLGFIGSPLATVISRWSILFTFIIYVFIWKKLHIHTWPQKGWDWKGTLLHLPRIRLFLFKQALPVSIGAILETVQLELIAIFAAQLGDTEVATHNALLNFFFFLTAIPLGLMTATGVRVGYYLGAGQPLGARKVAQISYILSLGIASIIGIMFVVAKDRIGSIYSSDEQVIQQTSQIAILVGGCYVGLSGFYSAMAILDGQGRPMVVAFSYVIGAWLVSIPMAHVMAFTLNHGLFGLWLGLIMGYSLVTIIVTYFVYGSDWYQLSRLAIKRAEIKTKEEQINNQDINDLEPDNNNNDKQLLNNNENINTIIINQDNTLKTPLLNSINYNANNINDIAYELNESISEIEN